MNGESLAGLKAVLQQRLNKEERGRQRKIARKLQISESSLSGFKDTGRKLSDEKILALAEHYNIRVSIRWEMTDAGPSNGDPVVEHAAQTNRKGVGADGAAPQLATCSLPGHDLAYRYCRDEILRIVKDLGLVAERFASLHLGREAPPSTAPRPRGSRNGRSVDRKPARRAR